MALKQPNPETQTGLTKLPEDVRNKMGYAKKGGLMKHSDIKKDMPMMKKVAGEAVKGHEKKMHGMKKGGVTSLAMKTMGRNMARAANQKSGSRGR